ncbi:Hypothetical protein A7982_05762 [Minicystis rosea]|nr:Hypothetical protein A7982_05762 [Minicystis rosea]
MTTPKLRKTPRPAPASNKRRSLHRRALLLALLAMTLPMSWTEHSSCQGDTTVLTGIEVMRKPPFSPLAFGLIFVGPVLFALVQLAIRRALLGLALELLSIVLAGLGALHCLVYALIGNMMSRHHYVAPWIALGAPLLMGVDAIQGSLDRITEWLEEKSEPRGDPPA